VEQVIHLLQILIKVMLGVMQLMMLVVLEVELRLLDKEVNQEQVVLEVQVHLIQF
jgi:hypothetical protein